MLAVVEPGDFLARRISALRRCTACCARALHSFPDNSPGAWPREKRAAEEGEGQNSSCREPGKPELRGVQGRRQFNSTLPASLNPHWSYR